MQRLSSAFGKSTECDRRIVFIGVIAKLLPSSAPNPVSSNEYVQGSVGRSVEKERGEGVRDALDWLPPRDSNPDMLIQSQLSCR